MKKVFAFFSRSHQISKCVSLVSMCWRTPCVFTCLAKWSLLMKRLLHTGQANLFSPVWVRKCLWSSSERVNLEELKSGWEQKIELRVRSTRKLALETEHSLISWQLLTSKSSTIARKSTAFNCASRRPHFVSLHIFSQIWDRNGSQETQIKQCGWKILPFATE